jgi:hypothetical protein
MIDVDIVRAPWSAQQVNALNDYQARDDVHEYTCVNDHDEESRILIATEQGWVCPSCDYKQDWAHRAVLVWMMKDKE